MNWKVQNSTIRLKKCVLGFLL